MNHSPVLHIVHRRQRSSVINHVTTPFAFAGAEVCGKSDLYRLFDVGIHSQTQGQTLIPRIDDDTLIIQIANRGIGLKDIRSAAE